MTTPATRPWHVLWVMLVGVFMTLIDWTAVSVANPSIMAALNADPSLYPPVVVTRAIQTQRSSAAGAPSPIGD